jgi:hypothetical protein
LTCSVRTAVVDRKQPMKLFTLDGQSSAGGDYLGPHPASYSFTTLRHAAREEVRPLTPAARLYAGRRRTAQGLAVDAGV